MFTIFFPFRSQLQFKLNRCIINTVSGSIKLSITMSTTRPKVLVTHPEVPIAAINLLKESCTVTICEGLPAPTREEILTKSKGMDGILWATHCKLNAEALDAAGPQLRSISSKSAGIDFIDVAEVKRRGIPLGHTPGVLSNAVADLAVGLMIATSRRFTEARRIIETYDWNQDSPKWMLGLDIQGSTVGIIGFGGIGQAIIKRLKGFDVGAFLYTGHSPKEIGEKLGATFVTFDELLKRSDFVVVCCPLNNETKGMFDAAAFSKMKSTGIFINVARGGIVQQDALEDALVNKRIYAAGLDVMSPEPLPIDNVLLKLENVVLIPHLGSATIKTRENMAILAAQNVLKGLAGERMICPV